MNSEDVTKTKNMLEIIQKRQIRFAFYCIIVSGLVGVFYREFGRVMTEGLSYFNSLHATYPLSATHGHLVNIGFIIPLGLALMTFLVKDKLDEKSLKKMNLWFTINMIAGIGTFLLMFYSAIHFLVLSTGETYMAPEVIDTMLFGGSAALRAILFATIHTSYGGSIVLYSIPIIKSLKK